MQTTSKVRKQAISGVQFRMKAVICKDCDRGNIPTLNSGLAGKEGNTSWHKQLTQKVRAGQNTFEGIVLVVSAFLQN